MDAEAVLNELGAGLQRTDAEELAKAMGVSLATAYRYRKSPLDMPLRSFIGVSQYLRLPVNMGIALTQSGLLEAEELRYALELKSSMTKRKDRAVITPHFTACCEIPEFTSYMFRRDFDIGEYDKEEKYLTLRNNRRKLYRGGEYKSIEIINANSYRDFFFRRNHFDRLPEEIWSAQLEEVLRTNELETVTRVIYDRSTPELPVILCFSSEEALVRVGHLNLSMKDRYYHEMMDTVDRYIKISRYRDKKEVARFFQNPDPDGG